MIAFLASNPWRLPHWPWLRAMHIVEGGPGTTPRRDGQTRIWIKRAIEFRTASDECRNDGQRLALAVDFPEIFWAHRLWQDNGQPTKWAIEAYILARASNREIAARNGCSVEIIEAYQQLFFNVREKLNHREYVLHTVIGESLHRGLTEDAYDVLWKLFGYFGGPHVVDALIAPVASPTQPMQPEDVSGFFRDTTLKVLKEKAALAALLVPATEHTQLGSV